MTLRAGASVRDISPVRPTALYGYPHVERLSTGIHDPLLASVLYLEHDGERVLLVALDLLFLAPPVSRSIRKRVAEAAGVPESGVLVSCTHTHSGPVTASFVGWRNDPAIPAPDPAYLAFVGDCAVGAARDAVSAAVPAALAWCRADARGVGGNRLSPDGITDPECGILAVRDRSSGAFVSVALIYGMHPTVLHEDSTLVSSDFPHYARLQVRETFGDGVPVLYHTAPCGNQSPRYFVNGQTFAEAERLGRMLGSAAVRALRDLPESAWSSDPGLDSGLAPVVLPRRALRPLEEARALLEDYQRVFGELKARNAPRPEVRTAECAVFGAEGTVALVEAEARGDIARLLARYEPLEVQALRIGEGLVLGVPGECFTEYALAIKQGAGAMTFVVSFVNGELQGYVVTPEAEAAGGYEATNAVFASGAGPVLVAAALALGRKVSAGSGRKGPA